MTKRPESPVRHERMVVKMKLILASSSPRRRELMSALNYEFEIAAADIDETVTENKEPGLIVSQLALQKAEAVFQNSPDALVIGADTLVFLGGRPLGKPSDEAEAVRMLRALSGRWHVVFSGVAIVSKEKRDTFFVRTAVKFYELSDDFIARYVATGEPLDKAGAYGIQQFGALLVERIDGDYFNVVGLPVASLARHLEQYGVRPKGF